MDTAAIKHTGINKAAALFVVLFAVAMLAILCGALHAVNRYAAPAHTNTAAQTWSADSTVWGGGFHQ